MLRMAGLVLLCGLLVSAHAWADDPFAPDTPETTQTTPPPPPPRDTPPAEDPFAARSVESEATPPAAIPRHTFVHDYLSIDVGFTGQYYAENIPSTSGATSTQSGVLPGGHIYWEHRFDPAFSLSASFDGWFSRTTYNGSSQNLSEGSGGVTPLTGKTDNRILHAELMAGYRVRDPHGEIWHAYGGLAFQDWLRDSRPTAGGYREQYDWFMLVVGIEYIFFHTQPWEISADVSGRWNVGGYIDGRLSDIPAAQLTDVLTTLGMAFGVRVQLPVRLKVNRLVTIEALPFFEYMPIGQSPMNVTVSKATKEPFIVQEPSSNSFFAGLLIGPRFTF